MIGLRQEAKSSPEALGRSAGVNSLSYSARRVGLSAAVPIGEIEPDIHWLAQLVWLSNKIEFVFSCQSRNKSTGASGASALAPGRLNGKTWQATR